MSIKKIFLYLVAFILLYICFIEFKHMGKYRLIFALICSLTLVALYYESDFSGCSLNNCLDSNVRQKIGDGKNLACQEMNRVCWRRSLILSFVVLIFINGLIFFTNSCDMPLLNDSTTLMSQNEHRYSINFVIFMFIWFLLYFWFNFDQYHRFKIFCENKQ
jgi:hypothetical protein